MKDTILKALGFLRYYKKETITIVIFSFTLAILTLLEPFFFRQIIDNLLSYTSTSFDNGLITIFVLWIGVVMLNILHRGFITYYAGIIQFKTSLKVWDKAYKHILSLSMDFFEKNQLGKIMKNMDRGIDSIYMVHANFFRQVIPNIFTVVMLIPLLFILNWKIGLLLIIIVPILSLIVFYSSIKGRKNQRLADEKWSELSGVAYDVASNISIVKSFTIVKNEIKRAWELNVDAYEKQKTPVKWWGITIGFSQFMGLVTNLTVFVLGGYLFLQGEVTIGDIVMFVGFSSILVNIFQSSFWVLIDFYRQQEKIRIFLDLLEEKPTIIDSKKAKTMGKTEGNIEFKDVDFRYEKGKNVLNNVSFKIKKGEVVAFVGHTGSGKSTTAKLISRFYDVTNGEVLVDSINIKDIKLNSLRKNIGIVFQENFFFNDSFLNNLRVGNEKATRKQVERACKYAHIWPVINNTEQGLDTIIGERGVKLSGGEKQRLGIARAILKNAPILVLDEATSALDAETENKVQKALDNLIKGRTTIIIAHRLSTIKKADTIFVFENGKIIEQGKFDSLLKKKGKFYQLVKQQMSNILID
jgi:ATP-binding cassette subfamily B protein